MTEPVPLPFDGKAFVKNLTHAPGVYRMYGEGDRLLYVGKAASLKKRVSSYFSKAHHGRIALMVSQIQRMEVTVTRSASEALLVENELIKAHKPRYNILLRDDKSYPYVLVTAGAWPRIKSHRGTRGGKGKFYGPYPSVLAVRDTLNLMHRLFKLRNCEDSVFKNRTRPCLQYQIGRCTAPCVGLISEADYAEDVRRAEYFLSGRSDALTEELTAQMHAASEALEFERAMQLRDLIGSIRKLQARESVENPEGDLDVLASSILAGTACVVLLSVRDGRNLGTRTFFPKLNGHSDASEALGAFLSQYYFEHTPPREIVVDRDFDEREILQAALSEAAGRNVQIRSQVRGRRAVLLDMARRNVANAVSTENASQGAQAARVADLVALLGLAAPPKRVECFDISHTQGEATVASCVVFDEKGAVRDQYRRYNITGITPGDDYAAMHQALSRRFRPRETLAENEAERVAEAAVQPMLPDVLLIDGGEGQLKQARDVMRELGVEGVVLVGVAKGVARKAGAETLILDDGREVQPGAFSPALQYIQQVRDEAHRFAITGHRGRRQKARTASKLEDIEGIGPRKRAALLKYFGGLGGLKTASVLDIAKVEGISEALAERIYAGLHGIEAMDPDGTQG